MSMIYGERVRLRAAERDDVKKFCVWINDPDVTRYLGAVFANVQRGRRELV